MKIIEKLPGLNGLRALAASMVLFGHVYQIAGMSGVDQAEYIYSNYDVGRDMVNLFFVISGFIITHILLKEKTATGDVSLRRFYLKRFLRIWPLYFSLLLIVFLLSNYTDIYRNWLSSSHIEPALDGLTWKGILVASLFFVNMNFLFQQPLSVLPHYWSLSVEEQFYILFPPFLKKFNPILPIILILLGTIIIKIIADFMMFHGEHKALWKQVYHFFYVSCFGTISIGCMAAYIANMRPSWLKFVHHPVLDGAFWLLFVLSILFKSHLPYIPFIQHEVLATIYAILLLNVAFNPRTLFSLENKFLDRIGTISYGLYMYHWPVIPIVILLLKALGIFDLFIAIYQIPLVLLCYTVTYIISSLSYKYLESPFLKLKPQQKVVDVKIKGQNYAA